MYYWGFLLFSLIMALERLKEEPCHDWGVRSTWQQEFHGDYLCHYFKILLFEASRKCILKKNQRVPLLRFWRNERLMKAKMKSLQRQELQVCGLTYMLQKAWALLRVVSAKGSATLGGFERRGHGWPQGFRKWLITLLWKDQRMNDRRHSTIVGGRKVFQVFCGCCCCFETETHEAWAALQLSVEQNDLEPLILLPPLPMCWDFRSAPLSTVIVLRSLDPESSRVRWSSWPLTTCGTMAVAESYPLAPKTGSPLYPGRTGTL